MSGILGDVRTYMKHYQGYVSVYSHEDIWCEPSHRRSAVGSNCRRSAIGRILSCISTVPTAFLVHCSMLGAMEQRFVAYLKVSGDQHATKE